ncbi:MAG: TonB family protein [Candidatus Eisenbacteria bacterium]|nr:TonB family protein [Candidatus Latescibacterota bacterium]MBD3301994.1 TonB family protein [Candidatus Eisenbacteria bacterium]
MRTAAIVSLALHVCFVLATMIGLPWKKRPSIRLTDIPIQLVSLQSASTSRLSLDRPAPREREEPPSPPVRRAPPPEPERREEAEPVPVRESAADREAEETPDRDAGASEAASDLTIGAGADSALRRSVSVEGGGSGEVAIGADGPISAYAYYLLAVRDRVATYWRPPAGVGTAGGEVASTVNFRIDRRGRVTASYVEEPSGKAVFDQAGLRAVAMADPLPPLPQDYDGDWLGIHLRFVFREGN